MDDTVEGTPVKDWLCDTLGGKYCNDESPVPTFSESGPTGIGAVMPPSQAPEGSVSPGQLKALQEWQRLLDAYGRGEASLLDLRDFDSNPLSGIEGWSDYYNDFITKESVLDESITDEKIRAILKSNGYSDEAIDEILAAEVDNDNFSGNNVLSNALCEAGYSNCSNWGVNPKNENGTECLNDDGPGTYSNGECVTTTTENTTCYETIDGTKVEGKRDADGGCVPLVDPNAPDCTVITQENAEECETDLDNLVECADNLVTFDVANPDDENGNPVPPTTVERPVYARSQEDCDNNTNTLFNCGGGIFANSRDECPDVGGVTDCNLEENKDLPECQPDPTDEFQGLYDEYGKEIVDKVKGLYDKIKNKWDRCTDPENAVECVGELVRTILPGLSEDCKETGGPTDEWYRNCVTVGVIIAIPGIDFPLPGGIGADATIGEIEDALKDSGKSIEDFLEDPVGVISEVFGNIWDKIKGAWEDTTDKTWGNLIKILTDAGFGYIVGILGDRIKDEIVVDSGNPFLPFDLSLIHI